MDRQTRQKLCKVLTEFNVPAQYDSTKTGCYPIKEWIGGKLYGAVQSPPGDVFTETEAVERLRRYIEIYERRIEEARKFLTQLRDYDGAVGLKKNIAPHSRYFKGPGDKGDWFVSRSDVFDEIDKWASESD